MQVNWKRYIKLMLPIRLRNSRLLFAIIWALTHYTRRKYDEEKQAIHALLQDLKYNSQVKSLLELLREKFSKQIEIIDDTNLDEISFVRPDNLDENTFLPMMVKPDNDIVLQRDFIVLVPEGVDKDKVRDFVERYVFCGVYFEVKDK